MTVDLVAPQDAGWLCCHAGAHLCALPLAHVIEIMRPQPVVALAGAPGFVQGLAVIRGEAVPVVSAAALLGGAEVAGRFVSLRGGAVLAVERVLGVREADVAHGALPLLVSAVADDMVSAIAVVDAEFLLFLNLARLVPLARQQEFAA